MRLFSLFLLASLTLPAQTVYYTLWFDTEDFIHPRADDAALKLALELERLGVKATFKVVAEKARVLEKRGRTDVIRALAQHDIGYHSENHSIPPTPAQYLSTLGMLEGAAEFERREGPGLRDVERIFAKKASCYGQPGNSWGPQSTIALRRLGVPAYVDEARQILLNHQPFWYGGLLHVYNLGPFSIRADINDPQKFAATTQAFDAAVEKLKQQGGGVIQTYYHPTEWVTTEFWDGVNFRHGQYTAPGNYVLPKERSKASEDQAYRLFLDFIRHVQSRKDVKIITAAELPALLADRSTAPSADEARTTWKDGITFSKDHSAAELLLALLAMKPQYVDGPSARTTTLAKSSTWPADLWDRTLADVRAFITQHKRLPSEVWLGSDRLSLADFAATLAAGDRRLRTGKLVFETHISADGKKNFDWVIHPEGFDGSSLLEMGRWQAWTLKPARIATATAAGTYLGSLATPAGQMRLALVIQEVEGKIQSEMISLDQGNARLPADTLLEDRKLRLSIPRAMAGYQAEFTPDFAQLKGKFVQGLEYDLVLDRVAEIPRPKRPQLPLPPFPYRSEDLTFPSKADNIRLAGTLTLPPGPGPFPAAILLTGSGPQDRDETLLDHKPFLVLADHLTRQGFAVLRYDDRGIGQSGGSFKGSTSVDFAEDAEGAFAYLATRKEIDPKRIVLIGHSEGGILAPMVAAAQPSVAAVVSLAGPAVPGEQIIKRQTVDLALAAGMPEIQAQAAGSVGYQQLLALKATDPWMNFYWDYDPAPVWEKVKSPVLALNGALDMQVHADTSLAVIQAALTKGGNTRFEVRKLDGLNHLFQSAATGAGIEYGRIEETFAPSALALISDWLKKTLPAP